MVWCCLEGLHPPSQLGVNLPKGERLEFLWVKNFPFLPRIALHFYLKNKKVLGRRGSTFCPRKSKNLGSHFFFLPFQVKKSVYSGSLYQSAVQSTSTPLTVRPVPSPRLYAQGGGKFFRWIRIDVMPPIERLLRNILSEKGLLSAIFVGFCSQVKSHSLLYTLGRGWAKICPIAGFVLLLRGHRLYK